MVMRGLAFESWPQSTYDRRGGGRDPGSQPNFENKVSAYVVRRSVCCADRGSRGRLPIIMNLSTFIVNSPNGRRVQLSSSSPILALVTSGTSFRTVYWQKGFTRIPSCNKNPETGSDTRRTFTERISGEQRQDADFTNGTISSDEARFYLSGHVNIQNGRIWGEWKSRADPSDGNRIRENARSGPKRDWSGANINRCIGRHRCHPA